MHAFYKSCFITCPILVTPIARIGDHILGVLLKHLQTQMGFDNLEVVGMNITCLCRGSCLYQVAGGAATGPLGLWSIIVLGVHPDCSGIGKLLILSVAREAEHIVIIGFEKL